MRSRAALFVALAMLLGAPANAQDRPQCWDIEPGTGKTFLNAVTTDRLRDLGLNEDAAAMSAFAGTWVGQTVYPDGSMVDRTAYQFEPNGLFQYNSETCGNLGLPCSQGYGHGIWKARMLQDGQIEVGFVFNDLQRESACGFLVGHQQGDTMIANGGFQIQRIR